MRSILGTCIEIKELGEHKKVMVISLQNGKTELFFNDLKGWNNSVKVGNIVKVYFKYSDTQGYIGYRVVNYNGAIELKIAN